MTNVAHRLLNTVWSHSRQISVRLQDSLNLRYSIPLNFEPENKIGNRIELKFNLIESALDTRFRAAVEKKGDVFVPPTDPKFQTLSLENDAKKGEAMIFATSTRLDQHGLYTSQNWLHNINIKK